MNFNSEQDLQTFLEGIEQKKSELFKLLNNLKLDYLNLKSYLQQNLLSDQIRKCSKNLRDLNMLHLGIKRLLKIEINNSEESVSATVKNIKKEEDNFLTGLSLFDFDE